MKGDRVRLSNYYLPTLREDPAEAVTSGHRLMARSAMIRMGGVGVYHFLPYGLELLERVSARAEEALFHKGLKVSLAALQGREIWEASGRWEGYGGGMYKVRDRYNRQSALAPESEEAFLSLISGELKSYKQLPLFLYEVEKRFQDIQKPKLALSDAREMTVIDGYRFDRSMEEAESFVSGALKRAEKFLEDEGIAYKIVETDEAYTIYGIGEGYEIDLAWTDRGAYLKDRAPIRYEAPSREEAGEAEDIHTPGAQTIKELSEMIGVEAARCTKAVDLNVDGEAIFTFIPGDRDLNLKKLAAYLEVDEEAIEMLDEERIREVGSFPGFTGPVGLSEKARVIVDRSVTRIDNMVVGANRIDYHKKNVNYGRDFEAEIAEDLLSVSEGDKNLEGESYVFGTGYELIRIKKPSTLYAERMHATFIDESGKEAPFIATGIRCRTGSLLTGLVENHSDENGLNLPVGSGAYDVAITVVNVKKEDQRAAADALYDALQKEGIAVLVDDRGERAGVKFKDRDLIGIPLQVTAGKAVSEGLFEYKRRGEEVEMLTEEAVLERIRNEA